MPRWIILDGPSRYAAGMQFLGRMIDQGVLLLDMAVVELSDDEAILTYLGRAPMFFTMLDQRGFGEAERPLRFAGAFDRPERSVRGISSRIATAVDGYINTRHSRLGEMWPAGTKPMADMGRVLILADESRDVFRQLGSQLVVPAECRPGRGRQPDPLDHPGIRPG